MTITGAANATKAIQFTIPPPAVRYQADRRLASANARAFYSLAE